MSIYTKDLSATLRRAMGPLLTGIACAASLCIADLAIAGDTSPGLTATTTSETPTQWTIDPKDAWLQDALVRWASAAGLSLHWHLGEDYPLASQQPRGYSGRLVDALKSLQDDINDGVDKRFQARVDNGSIEVYALAPSNPERTSPANPTAADSTNPKLWTSHSSEQTLRQTLERWGGTAGWDVVWTGPIEVQSLGRFEVSAVSFQTAAERVLSKAQAASRLAGIALVYKFEGRVLSIWEEKSK